MTEDKKAREAIRLLARRVNYLGNLKQKRQSRAMNATPLLMADTDPFMVDTLDPEIDDMVNAT